MPCIDAMYRLVAMEHGAIVEAVAKFFIDAMEAVWGNVTFQRTKDALRECPFMQDGFEAFSQGAFEDGFKIIELLDDRIPQSTDGNRFFHSAAEMASDGFGHDGCRTNADGILKKLGEDIGRDRCL